MRGLLQAIGLIFLGFFVGCLAVSAVGCAGTAAEQGYKAGTVTVTATSAARRDLATWVKDTEGKVNATCEAECPANVACFDACRKREQDTLDKVTLSLKSYRVALQASGEAVAEVGGEADAKLADAAAELVKLAMEIFKKVKP